MIAAVIFEAFKQWVEVWAVYYVVGYLGIYLHLYFSVPKAEHIHDWIRQNTREFVMSLICYNVLMFAWADGTLQIVKLAPESPNVLTILFAYSGQSVIVHAIEIWESKILPWGQGLVEKFFTKEDKP